MKIFKKLAVVCVAAICSAAILAFSACGALPSFLHGVTEIVLGGGYVNNTVVITDSGEIDDILGYFRGVEFSEEGEPGGDVQDSVIVGVTCSDNSMPSLIVYKNGSVTASLDDGVLFAERGSVNADSFFALVKKLCD